MHRLSLIALLVLAVPSLAHAELVPRIAAQRADGTWTTDAIQARLGEPVTLHLILVDGRRLFASEPTRVDGRLLRPRAPLPPMTVRWLRVEPRMQHVTLAPPNPGDPAFSNAVLTGPHHGDWLGYDTLEYDTVALTPGRGVVVEGERVTVSAAHPSAETRDVHGGAGSFWLAAEVEVDGRVLRTPDGASVDRFGLSERVMRVSFRASDDYVGWLATYFNVPNLFGSSGPGDDHQTERYVGADCADVLVGARRAMGAHALSYVSVAGLGQVAETRSEILLLGEDGSVRDTRGAVVRLRWGHDVAAGDLVTFDFVGAGEESLLPRAWDHVGALVQDDGDGVLGASDVVRHMAHVGLLDQPLSSMAPVRLRLFRFR
jgi:hypothetical protein